MKEEYSWRFGFSFPRDVLKLSRDAQAFIVAVVLFATSLIWLSPPTFPWEAWPELLLFFALIAFASMFPIPDPRGGYITAASVLFYVLIMVHGPWAGIVVASPAYAVGTAVSRRWLPWRTMFNGAQMGISVWLAGISFALAGGSIVNLEVRTAIIPLAVAVLVHQAANNFFVSLYFNRIRGTPFLATWIGDIRGLILSNLLSIPISVLLGYLYVSVHPLTVLLYLVSLPFQRRAHSLQVTQKRIFDQAIDSLVVAIDAGFPQGSGHSRRVANTATIVARHLGLSEGQIDVIELGALLHDVGMIGLDEILWTGDVSDAGTLERLKEHVVIGARISRELPKTGIAEIIMYHHEHFDGSGYPEGLAGDRIPIGARVVALAERFESIRDGGFPYGDPRSILEARAVLVAQAGKMFDPLVVKAFESALDDTTLEQEAVYVPSPEEAPGLGDAS